MHSGALRSLLLPAAAAIISSCTELWMGLTQSHWWNSIECLISWVLKKRSPSSKMTEFAQSVQGLWSKSSNRLWLSTVSTSTYRLWQEGASNVQPISKRWQPKWKMISLMSIVESAWAHRLWAAAEEEIPLRFSLRESHSHSFHQIRCLLVFWRSQQLRARAPSQKSRQMCSFAPIAQSLQKSEHALIRGFLRNRQLC